MQDNFENVGHCKICRALNSPSGMKTETEKGIQLNIHQWKIYLGSYKLYTISKYHHKNSTPPSLIVNMTFSFVFLDEDLTVAEK